MKVLQTRVRPTSPDASVADPVRLRLEIAYDGGQFSGWARQPEQRTVEGVLGDALATVLRVEAVDLTVAGRTDAGVHARGQVAHVDVPRDAYAAAGPTILARLAGLLPGDVRVSAVAIAADGFDARFAVLSRHYAYRVADTAYGVEPLRRHDVVWHRRPLDLDAMNAAAAPLVGTHEFAAFCRPREGATTVREVFELGWGRDADGLAVATVAADAFCHNMVRALVGALLAVGDGRRTSSWLAGVHTAAVRVSDVHVAPAHGLTLERVRYPDDAALADRVMQTRARREVTA